MPAGAVTAPSNQPLMPCTGPLNWYYPLRVEEQARRAPRDQPTLRAERAGLFTRSTLLGQLLVSVLQILVFVLQVMTKGTNPGGKQSGEPKVESHTIG